jgi:uncharacterized protein YjeT (DUF2065 family)
VLAAARQQLLLAPAAWRKRSDQVLKSTLQMLRL